MKRLCASIALTALLAVTAHAQKPVVYRCGSTYSQVPCEGARAVDASDSRSAQQQREAAEVARNGKAAGDRLERERLNAEALQAREAAARQRNEALALRSAQKADREETAARAAAARKKTKKKVPDYFTVAAPAEPKKK